MSDSKIGYNDKTAKKLLKSLKEIEAAISNFDDRALTDIAQDMAMPLHNLKAYAAQAGLSPLAIMVHRYESLFEHINKRNSAVRSTSLLAVNSLIFAVKRSVSNLKKDRDDHDTTEYLEGALDQALFAIMTSLQEPSEIDKNFFPLNLHEISPSEQKVLLIDDEPGLLEIHSEYIQEILGCTPKCVSSAKEALKLCEKEYFDFILTDHIMPQMTGMDFVVKLRESPSPSAQAPIIVITAYEPNMPSTSIDLENVFALTKPVELKKLSFYLKCATQLKKAA